MIERSRIFHNNDVMMKRKTKALCRLLFLVYFACYAVFPLSAAATAAALDDARENEGLTPIDSLAVANDEPAVVMREDGNALQLFLYDMLLWEILKRGKPSDDSKDLSDIKVVQIPDKLFEGSGGSALDAADALLLPLSRTEAACLVEFFHLSEGFSFSHSGLSPPFLPVVS